MRPRLALLCAGTLAAGAAAAFSPGGLGDAAAQTWPPFVLVTGLLLIGVVAAHDGVFEVAAAGLDRLPGGDGVLYVAAMALVALVTAVLNLDTSVAFLTPVLVHAARRRGRGEARLLYGCVFMSNAASLLLPGSNLTNLLVLSGEHVSGSVFLARMAFPWLAAVAVTAVVVALAVRDGTAPPVRDASGPAGVRGRLGWLGIASAVALTLALADPALPVLGAGLLLAGVRILQRRLRPAEVARTVDVAVLAGVFLVAVALGTVARVWSLPGRVMRDAGALASAVLGAVAAVLVNNLPAAVLLGSRAPAHPRALLIGLDAGPNLAVSGSLSALIWWQAARSVGARPSALRYSAVGLVLVPLTMAAALAAGRAVT
ncbi:MAG TPA: SLC13 family permease [Candidatus Dormibacteraeota bacterium]|nr:SLC13 family permease [Candidatus Dormibacteraeota bacterium]